MHEVCHTVYLAHGNSNGEIRERSRHQTESKIVVRNLEERNVGTKEKSPRQGPTSAIDLLLSLYTRLKAVFSC